MKPGHTKYIYVAIPIIWIALNGFMLAFSPGLFGQKNVADSAELTALVDRNMSLTQSIEQGSFSSENLADFEKLSGVRCRESYSDIGKRQPNPEYINGAMYGISCDLPRFWVSNAGIFNLLDTAMYSATFHFDENDILVRFGVGFRNYFGGLYY
ncbi:MAG: hypothetical protein AAFU54_01810 [Chloroflexota bacterium]